jgi:type III restriction enzyme
VSPLDTQIDRRRRAEFITPIGASGKRLLDNLKAVNADANPQIERLALKLATGAGKTTVMAMPIAWQTLNAVRRHGSKHFTRRLLIVTPSLTTHQDATRVG